jgi:hypothetical protein
MFYKPEKYLIPKERRKTKRIRVGTEKKMNGHNSNYEVLREKGRESQLSFVTDKFKITDIDGTLPK